MFGVHRMASSRAKSCARFLLLFVVLLGRSAAFPRAFGLGGSARYKYAGAVRIGDSLIFTPGNSDSVGVFDLWTSRLTTVSTRVANVTGSAKFEGDGAVVGRRVYFAPSSSDYIGVFDIDTLKFFAIRIYAGRAMHHVAYKYSGAAVVGSRVIFTPFNAHFVGVLDARTGRYSEVSTHPAGVVGSAKYKGGGTVVGERVYFTPCGRLLILPHPYPSSPVLPALRTVSLHAITAATHAFDSCLGPWRGRHRQDSVGRFDASTDSFSAMPDSILSATTMNG